MYKNCSNYWRIKLVSYFMKLWEWIIKLRKLTNVSGTYFGLMPERSIIKAIFLLRELI